METVKTLARWYLDRIKSDKRNNGDEFYKFECVNKAEDDHCRALALAAHSDGNILPDDHRYAFMVEALNAIEDADGDDLDDVRLEADIYTSELTTWLGSRADRHAYCDEAARDGLCSADADMVTRMQCGQYEEKNEVLQAVRAHLEAELEAADDDDTDSAEASS